jgi:hypothetical protein
MPKCYNSPSLAALLRDHGVDVAGTLHLNMKSVPAFVKTKRTKEG